MSALEIPAGLSPAQQRVFVVLQDWADAAKIKAAIRGKTPIKVMVSQMRARLAPRGLTIICDAFGKHNKPDKKWRIAPLEERQSHAARQPRLQKPWTPGEAQTRSP